MASSENPPDPAEAATKRYQAEHQRAQLSPRQCAMLEPSGFTCSRKDLRFLGSLLMVHIYIYIYIYIEREREREREFLRKVGLFGYM